MPILLRLVCFAASFVLLYLAYQGWVNPPFPCDPGMDCGEIPIGRVLLAVGLFILGLMIPSDKPHK